MLVSVNKKDTADIFLFGRGFSGRESFADVVELKERRQIRTQPTSLQVNFRLPLVEIEKAFNLKQKVKVGFSTAEKALSLS